MAQDGIIIPFNVDDLKLRKMISDSTGSTVYDAWLDAFGVQSFTLKPEYISKDLGGDGTTIDIFAKLKKLTGQFVIVLSFEVLKILMGGATVYDGDPGSEKAVYTIKGTDLPNYFEFDVQSLYRGGGDAAGGDIHFRIHKAKMTSFSYSMAFEDYATLQVDWEATVRLSDGQMGQIIENEAAETIAPGAADTTAPTVTGTSPLDAATGVAVNANVTWTFSDDINFVESQFQLYKVQSATDLQAASRVVTYDSGTKTVTLNPNSDMTGTKEYAAIAQGVRNKAGLVIAAPSVVNFTTV